MKNIRMSIVYICIFYTSVSFPMNIAQTNLDCPLSEYAINNILDQEVFAKPHHFHSSHINATPKRLVKLDTLSYITLASSALQQLHSIKNNMKKELNQQEQREQAIVNSMNQSSMFNGVGNDVLITLYPRTYEQQMRTTTAFNTLSAISHRIFKNITEQLDTLQRYINQKEIEELQNIKHKYNASLSAWFKYIWDSNVKRIPVISPELKNLNEYNKLLQNIRSLICKSNTGEIVSIKNLNIPSYLSTLHIPECDIVACFQMSNKMEAWSENRSTTLTFDNSCKVSINGTIGAVLYDHCHWQYMHLKNWVRFFMGNRIQPVYHVSNIVKTDTLYDGFDEQYGPFSHYPIPNIHKKQLSRNMYHTLYGPFYREILIENEQTPGTLYKYCYLNNKEDPRSKHDVYLMFPGESKIIAKEATIKIPNFLGQKLYTETHTYKVPVVYDESEKGHGTTWVTLTEAKKLFIADNTKHEL